MNKIVVLSAALVVSMWATAGLAQKKKPAPKRRGAPIVRVNNGVERDSVEKKEPAEKKSQRLDASNALLLAVIAPELGVRDFSYKQALLGGLRSYTNNAIPMGSISAEVYPFAQNGTPILGDIGLVGQFGTSLSFESKTKVGDQSAKATWSRWAVGARGRIHTTGAPGEVLVGIEGTYGDSKFTFTGNDPVVNTVPSVDYKYFRAGADVRVPIGAFSLLGGAGYRVILSSGPFGEKFPRASLGGVDGHLGGAYRVAQNVEVLLAGDYVRVFSKENPQPGDPFVAGGALDQYLVLRLGVSLLF